MNRAHFTIGFSNNTPKEVVDEIHDIIDTTFADHGYEVEHDGPHMYVDGIEPPEFESIMNECLGKLGAEQLETIKGERGHGILGPLAMMPPEMFDAMGMERLPDDVIDDHWRLPKGLF